MSVSVTARCLTVAVGVAAAAVGAFALPAAAAGQHPARPHGDVVISSVQYDSPGRDDRSNRSLNKEWVDITNTGRRTVNLNDWTLTDEAGHTYTFRHFRLDGRATVRVHTGEGRDSATDVYQDRRNYVWNNDEDTATLRDEGGRFVDDDSWGHHRDHRGDHRDSGRDDREGSRHDARG
ncbi:lamin tail domain-containing protein [Streptomyces hyaluromycini]|uniref:Lamin tail domain-containing protein n=1 Tax=Streptomyces hyaluromycini TaxID=1377993 RepID=A0ABV1WQ74_9ACTN